MARRSGLEELELTGEEVERLTAAFRDERFRSLFAEYAAELTDPKQRAIYETEVAALERQRGVDARFLHPTPGWVLRTSQAAARRCYINICSNPLVGRPEARPEPGGNRWTLPHCLVPGREELSRRQPRGPRRLLYDVLFHPDTLRLATRSARFRQLINDTALEALEARFALGLDRTNAVLLRGTKYKGIPQAALLRTPLPGGVPPPQEGGGGDSPLPPFPSPYTYPPPPPEAQSTPPPAPAAATAPTTPRWTLRHRSYVDLQDYRYSRDSAPSPVPRELEVTIELPLLSSAAQVQLEICGQELQLDSQRPAAVYRLRLPLPYPVDESRGRATFNKGKHQLVVTLPVVAKPHPQAATDHQASQEEGVISPEQEDPPQETSNSDSPQGPLTDSTTTLVKNNAEQTPLVNHVGTKGMEFPVCSGEIYPATSVTDVPICPATSLDVLSGVHLTSPVHVGVHVCTNHNSLVIAEKITSTVPCATNYNASTSEYNENTALEVPLSISSSIDLAVTPEDTGLFCPAPSGYTGNSVELPEHSRLASSASPVTPERLSPDMTLNTCPSFTDSVLLLCPDGTMIPSAHLGDIDVNGPVTTSASQSSSNVSQSPELSDSDNVPLCPDSSCIHLDSPVLPACPNITSHVELFAPPVCPTNRTSAPLLSAAGLDTDARINSSCCPDSPVPSANPTQLLCPPFHCTQNEESLTLLLNVPGIIPQSFKGEVGTNHYKVSFSSKDSAPYTFLLQFPPENKLTPPETGISVSLNNAVIGLAKSPETSGLWTKLYFGPNYHSLQERLFITEENVDGFLGSLVKASCYSQSKVELQPLIEVLDVSEGKSEIRLKAQEQTFELGKTEERVNCGREDSEQENGSKLSAEAENSPLEAIRVSSSLTAMETMERAGWGSGHCLELDPGGPTLARPGKLQISKLHESEPACATGKSPSLKMQAQLNRGEPTKTGEGEDMPSEFRGLDNRLAPPVLKETDMRDGSVQFISDHATHCAVTFQNSLLYELD